MALANSQRPSRGSIEADVSLGEALEQLSRGQPILLFDDPHREGETDVVVLAERVDARAIREMRQEAGGLLCVTTPFELASSLGLGYQDELLRELSTTHPVIRGLLPETLPYDRRSSFGLWVNARSTFTGVSDTDRALTISAVGRLVASMPSLSQEELRGRFVTEFHVPGHVPLLHSAPGLLQERRGHTELSNALAIMGGLTPSLALMEMLGDDGRALPREAAEARASTQGWPFVEGRKVTQAWSRWSE